MSAARPFWKDVDWLLLLLALASCCLGLVGIVAAEGQSLRDPAVLHLVKRQALAVAVGGVACAAFAAVDYHVWLRLWRLAYGGTLFLLFAVLAVGRHSLGAQRWIPLGPFDLQPSEVAKLALVVALAAVLAERAGQVRTLRDLWGPAALTAVPAALVAVQPDLGTALVLAAIFAGMVFAAGFPGWKVLLYGALLVGAAVGLIAAHLRWPHRVPLPLHGYQLQRLLAFLDPQADPQGSGYQILQSEMATGSGRLFGNGVLSGGAGGQLAYFPEANTDFIFATLGDALGFVGSSLVLTILGLVFWRVVACMARAPDALGALLAAGVASMLGFEVVLNAGMTLGLMPVTGVPLPFTSYGGSAVVVSLASVGVVESVYRQRRRRR